MNCKILIIFLLGWATYACVNAQSTLETVLTSVAQNNPSLVADRQFWEVKKLEYQIGLTIPNPTIQGQYLLGSPVTAGNQTDFFAVQPFDFPTTYRTRRQLANAQRALSVSDIAARRQAVLLETKMACLEMVYRNQLTIQYERRRSDLEKLRRDFQTKLDKGEGNVLDVNKATLKLLELSQLEVENALALQNLQTHLTALNGGVTVFFRDTVYPMLPKIASFEQLEQEIETMDPTLQNFQQKMDIAQKQSKLAKIWRLPKFEAGYHYQGILGQRFNGLHAGVTLPLWEQKYRMKQAEAQVAFAQLELQNQRKTHFFEMKAQHEQLTFLKKSLDDYRSGLALASSATLLAKALQLGEISALEYFLEMDFYQNAALHILKTEHSLQTTLARLLQHRL